MLCASGEIKISFCYLNSVTLLLLRFNHTICFVSRSNCYNVYEIIDFVKQHGPMLVAIFCKRYYAGAKLGYVSCLTYTKRARIQQIKASKTIIKINASKTIIRYFSPLMVNKDAVGLL